MATIQRNHADKGFRGSWIALLVMFVIGVAFAGKHMIGSTHTTGMDGHVHTRNHLRQNIGGIDAERLPPSESILLGESQERRKYPQKERPRERERRSSRRDIFQDDNSKDTVDMKAKRTKPREPIETKRRWSQGDTEYQL